MKKSSLPAWSSNLFRFQLFVIFLIIWVPFQSAQAQNDPFIISSNLAVEKSLGFDGLMMPMLQVSNQPPVISEGASINVSMDEDSNPLAFALILHATDSDVGDTLTWSISIAAIHGTAGAAGTGTSKAITYVPAADYYGNDSFTVQVSDGNGGTDSILVNVTINAVDDPPRLVGTNPTFTYTENNPSTVIDADITLTDIDGPNLNGVTVSISSNYVSGQDYLDFTPSGGVTGSFNTTTGVLTLSGSAPASTYQTVLRTVTYRNTSETPNTSARSISFVGDNTLFNVTNGHFYKFVTQSGISWSAANTNASSPSNRLYGMTGYLATITSSQENSFIASKLAGVGWIGASDAATEGTWKWVTGPEAGTTFCTGNNPCSPVSSRYSNWNSGEPNNGGDEDYGHMIFNTAIGPRGSWNDLPNAGGSGDYAPLGYIVEYGGMAGDPIISLTSSATINVSSVNDAPNFSLGDSVNVTMSENSSPTPFALTLYASDLDGDLISWSISAAASHGTATVSGTGTSKVIGYSPVPNYYGSDSFVVRIQDGNGGSDTITVNVTINSVNFAPIITAGSSTNVTMSEDGTPTAFALTLTATDADPEDTLTWSVSSNPVHGSAVASGSGFSKSITYSPATNYNGSDSFIVQVSDGNGGTDSIIVNVTINAVDDPPQLIGTNPTFTYTENDSSTVIDTGILFTDIDGPNLNGVTVSISSNYVSGQDYLDFTPSGGVTGIFNTTTGVLTLSGSAPASTYQTVLRSVSYRNTSNTPNTLTRTISFVGDNTLFNITNGHFYEFVTQSGISWSSANTGASASRLYGMVGYLATITSSQENSFIASKLAGVGWIGASDAATEGTWKWVTGPEAGTTFCTGNNPCSPVSSQYSNWNSGEPNNSGDEDYGHMIFNTAIGTRGSWNDLPNAGGTGDYSPLGYIVEYGGMAGDPIIQLTSSATINVQAVNDVPVITQGESSNVTMDEDGSPTPFSLTLNATDLDGDTLTWSIFSSAAHGTASVSGTGSSKSIAYTPQSNYSGSDSFVVQVSDGNGGSDTITINVTINQVNDLPVITQSDPQSVTMDEDGSPVAFALTLDATDVDGGELTWDISTPPIQGSASAESPGSSSAISYTPDANYNGSDTFTVRVTDAVGGSDTVQVNVTINPINDVPYFTETDPVELTIDEDNSPTAFSLTLHGNDIDLDELTWTGQSPASHGAASIGGSGNTRPISYDPDANYYGVDSFTIRINDLAGGIADIVVDLTINQVNDSPTVANYIPDQAGNENVPFSFIFAENTFHDVDDGTVLTYTATLQDGTILPAWLNFDPDSRMFSGVPQTGQVVKVRLTATDNTSLSVFDDFLILIQSESNASPINMNPLDTVFLVSGTPFSFQLPENGFVDEDGQPLEVISSLPDYSPLPSWLVFNPTDLSFSGTPPAPGELDVLLKVFDDHGGSISVILSIEVSEGNVAPTLLNRLTDQAAFDGEFFNFVFPANTFWDANGDALAYVATLADGSALPAWLSFNMANREFSGTPAITDLGVYLIRVTAIDTSAASTSDLFLLGVSAANRMILNMPISTMDPLYSDSFGSIYLPLGLVPPDSHRFLHIEENYPVPALRSIRSLNKGREITMFAHDGSQYHQFDLPIKVCIPVTQQDIRKAGGRYQVIRIGITDSATEPWVLSVPIWENGSACIETNHLSMFDLFYRASSDGKGLPATGFAPGQVSRLDPQPLDMQYQSMSDLVLEIPTLGVDTVIVGVPQSNGTWDVTWLGNQVGWLAGSAYPTWSGNSVITGHLTDSNGNAGVFAGISNLIYGDEIRVVSGSSVFIYRVRSVRKYIEPNDVPAVLQHKDSPWISLLTCQGYDVTTGAYKFRQLVQAELVQVVIQK